MIRLRRLHRWRYDTRPNSRPRYTVTWYRIRPECHLFEPYLELGRPYPSIERETADGYMRIWVDGHRLVMDVTHFERA